jgi:NTE family protein
VANIVPTLAGGGTRLPGHISVLQVLKDLEVDFTYLVGVSGGKYNRELLCLWIIDS